MTQESDGERVSVLSWRHLDERGAVAASVRWATVPEMEFELQLNGDGGVVEFTARSATGVSARGLRKAPIGEMQRAIRNAMANRAAEIRAALPFMATAPGPPMSADEIRQWQEYGADLGRFTADFADRPRPGAGGRGDAKYAAVAAMYVERLDARSAKPVQEVADQLHLGERTVRNYLFKARDKGLLTSLGQGKAGGQLTPRARALLEEGDD